MHLALLLCAFAGGQLSATFLSLFLLGICLGPCGIDGEVVFNIWVYGSQVQFSTAESVIKSVESDILTKILC